MCGNQVQQRDLNIFWTTHHYMKLLPRLLFSTLVWGHEENTFWGGDGVRRGCHPINM